MDKEGHIIPRVFVAKLKNNLEMEEYVTTITIGRNTTLGKWSQIYNLLRR